MIEKHLARRLVGAGKQRSHHGAVGAGGERLGEIAGIFDAAVGNDRCAAPARDLDRIHDGGELGYADTGDHARGADRSRADADLDRVRAGVDQRLGAFAGRDVAGNHLHRVRQALDACDGVEHRARMAVRGVDDHEVNARRDQPGGAIEALVADGGRGGDAQAPLFILAGVRIGHRLLDVLHRDQPDAAVLVVDHEQLFDPVLMEQALGIGLSNALAHGDEPLLGHQLGNLLARVGGESHVAVGENADELAGAAVAAALHHRDA